MLVDLASSFEVTVGTASYISTVYRSTGLVMGLVMGVLALRFKHKSLFAIGVASYGVGALGCSFSPDFAWMLFFQIFLGIGSAMVAVMIYALIGEFLPLEKRGPAVGLSFSMAFAANTLIPLISFAISYYAGWRFVLSCFIFPFSIVCLVLSIFALPSNPTQKPAKTFSYLGTFKRILSNKSAIVCMIGTMLVQIAYTFTVYVVSFYRLHFSMPLQSASICASAAGAMGAIGTVIGGKLTNLYGRKLPTVIAGLFSGILVVLLTFVPNIWMSVLFWVGSIFLMAMTLALIYSLNLEQVPQFRGTLMSINQTFRYAGTILGLMIGGLVLDLYSTNFQILMPVFGGFIIIMSAIVSAWTKDHS
jgi:predicted MFS family arabinose efflux permease